MKLLGIDAYSVRSGTKGKTAGDLADERHRAKRSRELNALQ